MRRFFLALFLGAVASGSLNAQNRQETIEGNGNLVTREVPVQSFSALKASGVYELKLSQGDKESVRIEADENLQELFIVSNQGNKLLIEMKKLENKNLKTKKKMRVYVTFRKLTDLELGTVGNVKSEESLRFDDLKLQTTSVGNVDLTLTANKVELENKSVGNITLNGKAQNASLKNKGVGNINAGAFVVQTLNIENSGVGNAEVNAEKECRVKDSWMGKVKNRGAAPVRKTRTVVI